MGSNKHNILIRLDIPSNCLAMVAQKWGRLIKPLLSVKQPSTSHPVTCDPADVLSAMVSQFLVEKNFEQYLEDENNYQELCNHIKYLMRPS
jgi:hypothetical protein